jgi:hypothetical protein
VVWRFRGQFWQGQKTKDDHRPLGRSRGN